MKYRITLEYPFVFSRACLRLVAFREPVCDLSRIDTVHTSDHYCLNPFEIPWQNLVKVNLVITRMSGCINPDRVIYIDEARNSFCPDWHSPTYSYSWGLCVPDVHILRTFICCYLHFFLRNANSLSERRLFSVSRGAQWRSVLLFLANSERFNRYQTKLSMQLT